MQKPSLQSRIPAAPLRFMKDVIEIARWRLLRQKDPVPHFLKRRTLLHYAKKYGIRILIETGTYRGDMIYSLRKDFDQIYSIEVQELLFHAAQKRFAPYSHIQILAGDSGVRLGEIMAGVQSPALFWLDGHWSGGITGKGAKDTPIAEELRVILNHPVKTHVILVDDARCFNGENSYPTIQELEKMIQDSGSRYLLSNELDIVRIVPK